MEQRDYKTIQHIYKAFPTQIITFSPQTITLIKKINTQNLSNGCEIC
jgi:hypothetical protein